MACGLKIGDDVAVALDVAAGAPAYLDWIAGSVRLPG